MIHLANLCIVRHYGGGPEHITWGVLYYNERTHTAKIRVAMIVLRDFIGVCLPAVEAPPFLSGDILATGTWRQHDGGRPEVLKVGYITTEQSAAGDKTIYRGDVWGAPPTITPMLPRPTCWYTIGDWSPKP